MKFETKQVDQEKGIVRVTTEDERWYKIGEQYIPSVTWICSYYYTSPYLIKWIADKGLTEADVLKKAAGERGSKIHLAAEQILLGKTIDYNSKFFNYNQDKEEELTADEYGAVMSLVAWLNKTNPEIIKTEYVISNTEIGYAGTVDLKCKINGEIYIVDFKTGQYVGKEYAMQLSAYKHAESDVQKIAVLQLGYKQNLSRFKFTEMEDKFNLFLNTKETWAEETAGQIPLQKDYPLSLSWQRKEETKTNV